MEKKILNRRQFLQFSAAATTVLLAACAPQPAAAPTAAPQEAEKPAAEAQAPEAEQAPAEAPATPVDLNLLMVDWNEDARTAIDEVMVPKFQEQNPGSTVTVDYTDWGQLDAKMMTSAAGGVQPDLIQTDPIEFGIKYYMKNLIAELDPLVEKTQGAADKLTDFYDNAISEACIWKGKLLAVPYLLDNRALTYRKDFFEEVGLDPNKDFANWEEFRAAAKALTISDGAGGYKRMGWFSNTGQFCFQTYVPFLWQNGGAVLNEDNTAPAFNSPEGQEALEFWTKLIREDKVAPVEGMQSEGDLSLMTSGAQAMGFQNYEQLNNVQKYAPELWDSQGVQILGNKMKASLWYANAFVLSPGDHPEGAWKLLQSFVFDDANFVTYLEAMGTLSPRKSLVKSCKHITPLHETMIKVMEAENSHTSPMVPFAVMELYERMDEGCQNALYGKLSPKEALAQAEKECLQIFERHANE